MKKVTIPIVRLVVEYGITDDGTTDFDVNWQSPGNPTGTPDRVMRLGITQALCDRESMDHADDYIDEQRALDDDDD